MDDPYCDDDPFGGDDAFLAAVDIDAMVSAGAGAAGGDRGGGGGGGSGGGGGAGGEEKSFSSAAANEDPYGGHDPNHDPFDDDDADPFASKGDAALASVDLDDPYGASGMGGMGSSSSAPRALTPLLRSPPTNEEMRGTLSHFYGHPDFREGQTDVLSAVFEGRDVAVFWATGSGKSLMYQLPALHSGKTVLVVSPLISLMQDQVVQLNNTAGSRGTGAGGGAGGGRSYPRGLACFLGRWETRAPLVLYSVQL